MARPDAKPPRCSYHDALAAIGYMKGVAMIDVARDDALISALMEIDLPCVHRIVQLYDPKALGYPTPEKVAALAVSCGLAPVSHIPAPEPEPRLCMPMHTFGGRVAGMVWGVITGVVTAVAVGWLTAAPWIYQVASWLVALLAHLGAFLYGPGAIALAAAL